MTPTPFPDTANSVPPFRSDKTVSHRLPKIPIQTVHSRSSAATRYCVARSNTSSTANRDAARFAPACPELACPEHAEGPREVPRRTYPGYAHPQTSQKR